MGSPLIEKDRRKMETQHQVALNSYKISKYEITFEQYDLFCEETGYHKADDEGWGRKKHPVINIDWHEANAFALWMGSRLPTEAEWEYACRAGTETTFNTGLLLDPSQANCRVNDYQDLNQENLLVPDKTVPVGSYAPNNWGLYDMHGNVCEWCNDYLGDYPIEIVNNPTGPVIGKYRVIRGGSWMVESSDCRSASRSGYESVGSYSCIGFRLVSSINFKIQNEINKEDVLLLLDHTDKIIESHPPSVTVFKALRLMLLYILEKHFSIYANPFIQSQSEGFSYAVFLGDNNKKTSIAPILDFIELGIINLKNMNHNNTMALSKEQVDRELLFLTNLKKALNFMLLNL
jgi:hypothetical protein